MTGQRVLVVEDQPLAAKDVEATLSVMDYEVVDIVRRGEEAIETAANTELDVVLMDIQLAGEMDGIEAARVIQDDHDVPIVFLTAHAEPETVGRAKQFGPYGYISKPVDAIELRTAIEVATHKRELDEELERSRIELASFAHTVSDSLAEPLEAIAEDLDRVASEDGERLSQAGGSALERARAQTGEIARMLEGLRAYAEAGDVEVGEPTDAEGALDRALENLGDLVEDAQAEISRGPLPRLLVPEEELVNLFEHLVRNAIQHSGVDRPQIHVSAREGEDTAVVSVEDNGRGIPPGAQQDVFGLFQRSHTEAGQGAGVGLAVSRRIAEACGGGIWVESQPGEGSTFLVRLPSVPDD